MQSPLLLRLPDTKGYSSAVIVGCDKSVCEQTAVRALLGHGAASVVDEGALAYAHEG